jgi:N-acetylglutamate synthase-like GNAT family acetyltransferase
MNFNLYHEFDITEAQKLSISELLVACFDGYPSLRTYIHTIPACRIVVTDKEKVIGHVALHYKNVLINKNQMEILGVSDFCIAPHYRNKTIGRQLFSQIVLFAKKNKVKYIISFSAEDKFYQKLNFTNISCRCCWLMIQEGRSLGVMNRFMEHGIYVYTTLESEKPEFKELDLLGPPF